MAKTISKKEYLAAEIRKSLAHWNSILQNGCSDPHWADGCNMNIVRGHIISFKKECEAELLPEDYPEEYFLELPPVVDNKYMARPDEIRKHARENLEAYEADKDYLFLKNAVNRLTEKQKAQTCIIAVINYAVGLRMCIERDLLVEMRRHEYPERYLESFRECRERVEEILGAEPEERELPLGQLSIFDYIRI